MTEKPEYFRLHEEEDRAHFKKLQVAIDKLPCKEDLDNAVKGAVKEHVNGKIDSLRKVFEDYVKEDMKWKETANVAVSSYQKGSAFLSVLSTGVNYLLPIFGFVGIIYGLISWLK